MAEANIEIVDQRVVPVVVLNSVCIGYRDLTLPSLLTAPAAMLTVSGRDYVERPTHEFGAKLDYCTGFP